MRSLKTKKICNIKLGVFLLSMIAGLTAYNQSKPQGMTKEYQSERFDYSLQEVSSFCVDQKKLYVSFYDKNMIKELDKDGNLLDELDLGEGQHSHLCKSKDRLYALSYTESEAGITEYFLDSKERIFHPIDKEITSVTAMTEVDGKLYLIYRSEIMDPLQQSVRYDDEDDYFYMGEQGISLDLASGKASSMDIMNVIALKKYSDHEVIYYAYDDLGGYYFTIYDTKDNSFSDKIYNEQMGYVFSFDVKDQERVIYSDFSNRKLVSCGIEGGDGEIDFASDLVTTGGNDIQLVGKDCYVLDNASQNIFRMDYEQAVHDNQTIRFCSSEIYSEVPFGCGYQMDSFMLEDEEFALKILAGDRDYDICMMSFGQDFSKNIHDKGAFYPLNELPNVQKYLDSCFPYIKEAARDENGNIWMLPIAVDVPFILYHPENCRELGIQFEDKLSWKVLMDLAGQMYETKSLRNKYQLNGYQLQGNLLKQYNSNFGLVKGKASYDTDLFRDICKSLKATDVDAPCFMTRMDSMSSYLDLEEYYDNFYFEEMIYKYEVNDPYPYQLLRAVGVPEIQEGIGNCADCIFLCVNGNSENLEAALDFINTYCSYMLTRKDTFMFQDMDSYAYGDSQLMKDLYEIYSNATIDFELPREIFWEDYQNYLEDKISLEDFIQEVEAWGQQFCFVDDVMYFVSGDSIRQYLPHKATEIIYQAEVGKVIDRLFCEENRLYFEERSEGQSRVYHIDAQSRKVEEIE